MKSRKLSSRQLRGFAVWGTRRWQNELCVMTEGRVRSEGDLRASEGVRATTGSCAAIAEQGSTVRLETRGRNWGPQVMPIGLYTRGKQKKHQIRDRGDLVSYWVNSPSGCLKGWAFRSSGVGFLGIAERLSGKAFRGCPERLSGGVHNTAVFRIHIVPSIHNVCTHTGRLSKPNHYLHQADCPPGRLSTTCLYYIWLPIGTHSCSWARGETTCAGIHSGTPLLTWSWGLVDGRMEYGWLAVKVGAILVTSNLC